MNERILLAYSGSLACSAAVAWLAERHGAEVVTVTLDVGQTDDLDEVRARALTCGAVRAHVIDGGDAFAGECVIPALRSTAAGAPMPLATLAHQPIARALAEVGAIETADAVAHASRSTAIDAAIAAVDPALRILAPAREWEMDDAALVEYARARHLPVAPMREPHILIRRAVDPARATGSEAELVIAFERGVPVSLNGVSMSLQELIESLSLIGGQHGIGYADPLPAPAAAILRAAYAAGAASNQTVRLKLHNGSYAVQPSELVNHS